MNICFRHTWCQSSWNTDYFLLYEKLNYAFNSRNFIFWRSGQECVGGGGGGGDTSAKLVYRTIPTYDFTGKCCKNSFTLKLEIKNSLV